jgi:hypothetical protein
MNRDARAQIIAAFREIADGRWERSVGTDGGRKLRWEGKLGMIAASTAAIDNAHAVLSEMGSRFAFVRMGETEEGTEIAKRALANVGHEAQMRKELSDAYRGLLEDYDRDLRARVPGHLQQAGVTVRRDPERVAEIDAHAADRTKAITDMQSEARRLSEQQAALRR